MRLLSTNPILFKVKYINKDRIDTTIGSSAVLGSAFHTAMEVYYGGSDILVPTSESEAIEFGMKAGLQFLEDHNDGYITYSTTLENKQKLMDKFSFCFNEYVTEKPYEADKVVMVEDEIEEHINVQWRGQTLDLPVKLKGYIDKVTREDGKLKIVDYKTCYAFSKPDKIDGAKILQAVIYYLLAYAKYGEEPYSLTFEEVKYTQNKDHSTQVQSYEIIFSQNELYFDFFFRFYEDMTRALNGEMVYIPNVSAMFDNEIAIIAYIHRLDVPEETAKMMSKHKVKNVTDLLKKEMQSASSMGKLLKTIEANFVSAKSLDYSTMTNEEKIRVKLMEHGMMIQYEDTIQGSTVDLYRYTPSIGLKMARIRNYNDDVEQVLGIAGVRILAPIPGTSLIGFEVPRSERTFPSLPIVGPTSFDLFIGQTINGGTRTFDIRKSPHMLVAGSSGSGKSVFLHSIIRQLKKISNVELVLLDPKMVEFSQYEGQVSEYQSDKKEILISLRRLVDEMDKRYVLMKALKVKDMSGLVNMPYIFCVIDEYADLVMQEQTSHAIQLLAQKGRACGIHLIIATQRASSKIISGDIKVNFGTKAIFRMSKAVDSMVMLDEAGAEKLLGMGDMIFSVEGRSERLQAFH